MDKAGKEGPNRILYFHTDVNGAPEEMTDSDGKIVWETGYQVWGNTIQEKDHGGVEQNLRYQGQYLDRETGLHYNLHRYYDPDVGRFMVTDPIGLAGGLNLYAYAPNPLKYIDPLGLKKELCNGTTRVRHYTNRKGSNAIAESGIIKAHDNGRVYLEPANKKPLSQVDIEAKYQIGRGKGRDYVETDVPNEQLEWVTNPRYHIDELTVKGDIVLSDNAKITRRK
ncbi:RHS domain-containing protein [Escherichia coli]|nr:RHS domain-containing protein [Escherichia coli]